MHIGFLKETLLLILLIFTQHIFAQKAGLEVVRCTAVDRNLPVTNLTIDDKGRKWASNSKGTFQIRTADLGAPLSLRTGENNVLAFHGGNTDFVWSEEAFRAIVKTPCSVTAAYYDSNTGQLWVGTDEAGLFLFATDPQLKLMEKFTSSNSKLKSNSITTIFRDQGGRYWIGTEQGIMYGTLGKWKADLSGYKVQRVRQFRNDLYVLADGEITIAINGERWQDLALDEKKIEGEIHDFDIENAGKMWILSGIITQFDTQAEVYHTFSGPENYTSEFGRHIAIDAEGIVWVGSEDKGLYKVDKADAMTCIIVLEQGISCNGNGKDAYLRVRANGGVAPYTYSWNEGLSGDAPKNVAPGNYTVTATDSKGKARTATVQVPDTRLKLSTRQKKPVTGPGKNDGAAVVEIDGNASGITVNWDNGETLVDATKLSAGVHSVTVTNQKGCTATATVNIIENAQPLEISIAEKGGIKCHGDKTAALSVQVKGGKGPFQYAWNDNTLKGDQLSNLAAGDYIVTVTDVSGQKSTATLSIKQPEKLTLSAIVDAPASVGKADGKAEAKPKGGNGTYLFQWDSGESGSDAVRLEAGKRGVTVTDGNGCKATASLDMTENILAMAVFIEEKKPVACAGTKTGMLETTIKGGKPPYDFAWSDPSLKGGSPINVGAGDYSLTVTDAAGGKFTVSTQVKEPLSLKATATTKSPASTGNNDGKAEVQAQGGTGALTYKWDNGENDPLAIKLSPGKHRVTVTDSNGCTVEASTDVSENITPLQINISENAPVKCPGDKNGALVVEVKGGKGPFQYSWSNPGAQGDAPDKLAAGTYTLTVSDAAGNKSTATYDLKNPEPLTLKVLVQAPASTNNSDGKAVVEVTGGTGKKSYIWDNGEVTVSATKLPPGKRSITVTDANGCSATSSGDISENILAMQVALTEKTAIKCNGEKTGAIEAKITGGKSPFQYQWNDPTLKGESLSGLVSGIYTLVVTDAVGTKNTATITIRQPDPLTLNVVVTSPASTNNADGKATAEVLGGTKPYSYTWDNGETTANALKLAPLKHNVSITDANGCKTNGSVDITENILALEGSIDLTKMIKCADKDKAAIQITVRGGKAPYTYAWNKPGLSGTSAENLEAGDYIVTVTDTKGSTRVLATKIGAPEPLKVTLSRNIGATSAQQPDGKAAITISGGIPSYNIVWDNQQTSASVNRLPLGRHSVSVTDANGCSQVIDFETDKRIIPELTGAIENGQKIRMKLLNFDTDSSSVKPEALPVLDELYEFLVVNSDVTIEVGGHTNNVPSDAFADQLSAARAKAVADYLVKKGIPENRVQHKGYGKRQPIESNLNAEGRKINQRVEIKIVRN